jgi:hypothetical protein
MLDQAMTVSKNEASSESQQSLFPTFGSSFLNNHAGRIISDPRFAIVELVANAWDAGATNVRITWPEQQGEIICIEDNGTGMTPEEFRLRWNELSYDRTANQGEWAEFPPKARKRNRVAFGRNGVGRHARFCFAEEYIVETKKDGHYLKALVQKNYGRSPFNIVPQEELSSSGNGTKIHATALRNFHELSVDAVISLIGARFVADPEFNLSVNEQRVLFTDLDHYETFKLEIKNIGEVIIRRFDNDTVGRTSQPNGVAWWVKGRLVGNPSWEAEDGPLLDARSSQAKRLVYVVEADFLHGLRIVKKDWSGFYVNEKLNQVRREVSDYIRDDLRAYFSDERKERKRAALKANRSDIKDLPPISQEQVARFADELQLQCPTISTRDLDNAVSVLAKLEKARTGYSLLAKLSLLDPSDLDGLNAILDEWSVTDAKKVLGELRYRLDLIQRLEDLVDKHTTDELHDLQPLFERGLWIFGPQFESVSFTSNRSLATVVKTYFGSAALSTPRNRPDFVALPDSSIGVYSADAFDKNHEVCGVSEVVIVELKKGGFRVTNDERDQANHYARELRKSGKVNKATKIICYVLGSKIDQEVEEESNEGNTVIYPRPYSTILKQAHARTFHLLKKIENSDKVKFDIDLEEVVLMGQQGLFEEVQPIA